MVTPYEVLDASGHVDQFTDPIATCSACGETHRADHLIGEEAEGWSIEDIRASFIEDPPGCTSCGSRVFDEIQEQNLMFTTNIGIGAGARRGYLRPETAQGMFTAFPMLHRHFRERLPFGAMQVGRGYRNEISPRQGMIRLREFSMAEIEYFIDPEATWARDRAVGRMRPSHSCPPKEASVERSSHRRWMLVSSAIPSSLISWHGR